MKFCCCTATLVRCLGKYCSTLLFLQHILTLATEYHNSVHVGLYFKLDTLTHSQEHLVFWKLIPKNITSFIKWIENSTYCFMHSQFLYYTNWKVMRVGYFMEVIPGGCISVFQILLTISSQARSQARSQETLKFPVLQSQNAEEYNFCSETER